MKTIVAAVAVFILMGVTNAQAFEYLGSSSYSVGQDIFATGPQACQGAYYVGDVQVDIISYYLGAYSGAIVECGSQYTEYWFNWCSDGSFAYQFNSSVEPLPGFSCF